MGRTNLKMFFLIVLSLTICRAGIYKKFSRTGDVLVEMDFLKRVGPHGGKSIVECRVERDGELLYVIRKSFNYDSLLLVVDVSDNGRVCLLFPYTGVIEVYDSTGGLAFEYDLFERDKFSYDRKGFVSISDDGDFILVLNDREPFGLEGSAPTMFLFKDGEKILEKQVEGLSSSFAKISPKGNILIISTAGLDVKDNVVAMAFIFNRYGNLIKRFNFETDLAYFSESERFMLIGFGNQLFALDSVGKIFVVKDFGAERILSFCICESRRIAVVTGTSAFGDGFYYPHLRFQVFDFTGRKVYEELRTGRFFNPQVFFSEGKFVLKEDRKTIIQFRIDR